MDKETEVIGAEIFNSLVTGEPRRGDIPILAAAYKKKGARNWTPRELGIFTLQDQMNSVRIARGHDRRNLSLRHVDALNLARKVKNQQPIENYTAIAMWSERVMHLSSAAEMQVDKITGELQDSLRNCLDFQHVMQAVGKVYSKNKDTDLKTIYDYTNRRSVYALDHVIGVDYMVDLRRVYIDALDIINAYNATWQAIAECWDIEHVEEVQVDLGPIKKRAGAITNYTEYIKLLAKSRPRLYKIIYTNPNIKEALSPFPFYTEPYLQEKYDIKARVKDLTAFTAPQGDAIAHIKPRWNAWD